MNENCENIWAVLSHTVGAICPHCHELFRQSHLTKCRFQDRLLVLSPQHVVTKYLSLPLPADGATALNFINFMLQNRHLAALAPAFGWLEFWIRPRNNYST
jgi:hypothetical protein